VPEALLEALLYDHRLVDMYEPKPEGSGKYTKHQAFLGSFLLWHTAVEVEEMMKKKR